MAQKVKVLAAKPKDPSSIPTIHMVEGKNQLSRGKILFSQVVLGFPMHTRTHKQINVISLTKRKK